MATILKIKTERFQQNSESLCCSDASDQVTAQSRTVWEEMLFEVFQNGRQGGRLGYRNGTILPIKFSMSHQYPQPSFGLIRFTFRKQMSLEDFQDGWRPSWISKRKKFSNSESLCCSGASRQFFAQSNL